MRALTRTYKKNNKNKMNTSSVKLHLSCRCCRYATQTVHVNIRIFLFAGKHFLSGSKEYRPNPLLQNKEQPNHIMHSAGKTRTQEICLRELTALTTEPIHEQQHSLKHSAAKNVEACGARTWPIKTNTQICSCRRKSSICVTLQKEITPASCGRIVSVGVLFWMSNQYSNESGMRLLHNETIKFK